VATEPKPTERMVLEDVMKPMAEALDAWAVAREKTNLQAAGEARELGADIRGCLENIANAASTPAREDATKRLQLLRSNALEFLARYK
jgi:hypothetical protein